MIDMNDGDFGDEGELTICTCRSSLRRREKEDQEQKLKDTIAAEEVEDDGRFEDKEHFENDGGSDVGFQQPHNLKRPREVEDHTEHSQKSSSKHTAALKKREYILDSF